MYGSPSSPSQPVQHDGQALPADDPKQRQPDITLAKKYLKWEPKVPLEQGIEKTIEYFRAEVG